MIKQIINNEFLLTKEFHKYYQRQELIHKS